MDSRSNDSRRFSNSSYSSSQTTGVKSKWIKAFRSLKLTAVGGSNRNNDLADLEAQKVYRISVQLGVHAFQEYTYKKITACDVCREILRGHSRQGLKCKLCKMNVHPGNCQENAPKCQPKPRLLRKQKSASELETKITIPQLDDEKYQNYDPVYQSLRATADARKCAQYISDHYSNCNSPCSINHHQSTSNIQKQDSFGSSGSISNNNNNSKSNKHPQTGSNDSIGSGSIASNSGSLHQRKETTSCPPPPTITMQHRNSDSEFQQHQQYMAAMAKQHQHQQQQQQQQPPQQIRPEPEQVSNHIASQQRFKHYITNNDSDLTNQPQLIRQMYHPNGNGNSNHSNMLNGNHINQNNMVQKPHNTPALLSIAQSSHQAYSAPHSPQKKRLTLRMKSLSLDSPESAETLKDKRQAFFGSATSAQQQPLQPAAHPMDYHQSIMNEPPPLPSTMPPSASLMQNQAATTLACYDSGEMIKYQFKSSQQQQQQQNYQMSKRFKLGMHGRMRSFERDDPIINDLPPSSMSPCPSPKPQRLLPTNIFVVLYNFRSRQADELNLRAGYLVTVVDTTDPDWWQGKCMGKVGYFPSKYVTKLFPGERPLQVIHTVQLTDGEFAIKLLREQIVIQVAEEMNGIIMVRTGINDKIVPCPSKYLQEIII